jgi:hypothetical protein
VDHNVHWSKRTKRFTWKVRCFDTDWMKFFPPEDEIRAQLRELTSQTRQLRADLQGLIKRRGPSGSAFAHDHRYRLKPEPASSSPDRSETQSNHDPKTTERKARSSRKKR